MLPSRPVRLLLLSLLSACAKTDSADATPPPCGLVEGAWTLTVGGDDPVCTNGLETANDATVTSTCTSPDEALASLTWEGKGIGQAITCTNAEDGLHCAFGGINLTATLADDGRSFSGEWSGISCSGTWSGAAD